MTSALAEALTLAEQTVQNNKYGMAGNDDRVVILAAALLSLSAELERQRPVVEAAERARDLATAVVACNVHEQREGYLAAHDSWLRATDETDKTIDAMRGKVTL